MDTTRQLIDKFNRQLAEEFGRNPHGEANFKWAHTSEMQALEETGYAMVQLASRRGLVGMQMDYRPLPWADLIGPRWCVTKWEHRTRAEWQRTYGCSLPWPKHGEYVGLHSSLMPEGAVPDEHMQRMLVYRLRQHLGMTDAEHDALPFVQLEARNKETMRVIRDQIEDMQPAFLHEPGAKDDVSVPTPAFLQSKGALE